MIKSDELIKKIEKIAPIELQESWDNSGIQFSYATKNIKSIYISLDPTFSAIKNAFEHNCDFILTHHPLLFDAPKDFNFDTPSSLTSSPEKKILMLFEYAKKHGGLCLYSSHTSFDSSSLSMNYYIPKKIFKAKNISPMNSIKRAGVKENLIGTVWTLNTKKSIEEIIKSLKKELNIKEKLNYVSCNSKEKSIKRIALCGGAGSFDLENIDVSKIDLFITGDVKYHTALNALENDVNIIDLTHYHSEKIFIDIMANEIKKTFGSKVKVILDNSSSPISSY